MRQYGFHPDCRATRKRLPEFSAVWAYTPELESSLISERVTAGMRAAESRGRHLGRPGPAQRIVSEIEALATSTDLSVRAIQKKIAGRASRGIVATRLPGFAASYGRTMISAHPRPCQTSSNYLAPPSTP